MSNINENNEIENMNKEISLLQDRLKINEKSLIFHEINLIKLRLFVVYREMSLSKSQK